MQTELFELSSKTIHEEQPARVNFLEKTCITLRFDQALGLILLLLVFYALTFAWGVEKGRRSVPARTTENIPVATMTETQSVAEAEPVEEAVSSQQVVPVASSESMIETGALVSNTTETSAKFSAAAKPEGKYTIQHITYFTQSAADREIQKLAKIGHTSFIIPSGKFLQVCVDAFPTRQEASKLLKQLKTQGVVSPDAYVRSIPA